MEEYSYTSTHPLGHTGPVTGSLYLFFFKEDESGYGTWCNDTDGGNLSADHLEPDAVVEEPIPVTAVPTE